MASVFACPFWLYGFPASCSMSSSRTSSSRKLKGVPSYPDSCCFLRTFAMAVGLASFCSVMHRLISASSSRSLVPGGRCL